MKIILPKAAQKKRQPDSDSSDLDQDSHSLFSQDFSHLALKPDAQNRPFWVCNDGRIILEAFSPLIVQAQDFLITIAEPVTRPLRIHEYKITAYSLYAAVSVGMDTTVLLEVLDRFSKVQLPPKVVDFIKDCTMSYGKVKLVLKHNKYYIESSFPEILQVLLHDPIIKSARVKEAAGPSKFEEYIGKIRTQDTTFGAIILDDDEDDVKGKLYEAQIIQDDDFTTSFQVNIDLIEEVKRKCTDLDYPLMEEYDFKHDELTPNLVMDLSPRTIIRDYQEKSLSKMFGGGSSGGRARSGIIVLPTGAGKTLVGITAACTIKKSVIVLCTNAISVQQWSNEFRRWSTIPEESVAKFTADSKQKVLIYVT